MRERFEEHCSIISGYAFKSEDLLEDSDVPVIKIGNISNGEDVIIDEGTQYVNVDFLSIDEKYHIKKGDILISLTGSHINQPNSIVGRTCRNYSDKEYLLNQRAGKVIVKKNTDIDYLYYLFMLRAVKENIVTRAYGAANQVNISPTAIESMKWDFPDISKQKTIGRILSTYDQMVINNNKRIKILEQMAENLYKEWFVRFRFPGYEDAEFEDGIPLGWEIKNLEELYVTSSGGTPSRSNPDYYNGRIPWAKTGELLGSFIIDTEEHISEEAVFNSSAKIVPKNSLLVAMYAGTNVGNVGIANFEGTCNQACCVINPKDGYSLYYLYQFIKTQKNYLQSISFGAAQQNISQEIIKHLKVLMPSKELVDKFESIVRPFNDSIKNYLLANENLIKQRDLLLPRLISGKVEIK